MTVKIDLSFLLKRRGWELEDFLSKFSDIAELTKYADKNNISNFKSEEVLNYFSEKNKVSKSVKKPRRRRTRTKKSKKVDTKETDSSYFETWKVPYVEPE